MREAILCVGRRPDDDDEVAFVMDLFGDDDDHAPGDGQGTCVGGGGGPKANGFCTMVVHSLQFRKVNLLQGLHCC